MARYSPSCVCSNSLMSVIGYVCHGKACTKFWKHKRQDIFSVQCPDITFDLAMSAHKFAAKSYALNGYVGVYTRDDNEDVDSTKHKRQYIVSV